LSDALGNLAEEFRGNEDRDEREQQLVDPAGSHRATIRVRAKPCVLLTSSITPIDTMFGPGRTMSVAVKISGFARSDFSDSAGMRIGCVRRVISDIAPSSLPTAM